VTFFIIEPRLSLFALFLYEAQKGYFYFYVELISWVTITYMCICAYYTVFRIRIFNYYYFAPHHQTDPNSLLFSGLLLSRLTYALCLNFLSVIHLDSHITGVLDLEDTAFTSIMGHMDVLSFIANGFNIYYPMSIVLVCMATYFSLGSRCLNCLGFQAFVVEDDVSVDYVAEGKDLVRREKRERDVSINPGDTRQRWTSRGQELKDKLNKNRGESSSDISVDPTPMVAGSSTRLVGERNIARYLKSSRHDDDRVELLSDVDDQYSSSRYSPARSDRTVPKNVFDDI
ncbi:LMBR1 domain-containing 2-like, partial [Paramuricea clavata]